MERLEGSRRGIWHISVDENIETSDYLVRQPRRAHELRFLHFPKRSVINISGLNGINCMHPAKVIPGENKLFMLCICTKHEKRGGRERENVARFTYCCESPFIKGKQILIKARRSLPPFTQSLDSDNRSTKRFSFAIFASAQGHSWAGRQRMAE